MELDKDAVQLLMEMYEDELRVDATQKAIAKSIGKSMSGILKQPMNILRN